MREIKAILILSLWSARDDNKVYKSKTEYYENIECIVLYQDGSKERVHDLNRIAHLSNHNRYLFFRERGLKHFGKHDASPQELGWKPATFEQWG